MKFKMFTLFGGRSSRIGYEFYKNKGQGFLKVWLGSPTHHRWYAFSFYLYFSY